MQEELEIEDIDFVIADLQRAISQIAGTIQLLKRKRESKQRYECGQKWKTINGR